MANRIPLIVDRDDQNKLKELPVGDNLNLTGSGIVGAGNIEATGLSIAGISYNPFSGSYNDLTDKPNVAADTDGLPEGNTNLFFTNERVDDRVAAILVEGAGIDITYDDLSGRITITNTGGGEGGGSGLTTDLTGLATNQVLKWSAASSAWVNGSVIWNEIASKPNFATVATTGSYNDLVNKPILVNDIDDLADVDTSSSAPTVGQVLKWDGAKWAPADDITSGGGGLDASTLNGFAGSYYLDYTNLNNKPTLFDSQWSSLVGTPTTLSGYGITDAISTTQSYTQNGTVHINDNGGLLIGQSSNLKLRVDNDVIVETLVAEQDLDIRVRPLAGAVSAIKVDTGTQRVGIFSSNPTHKLTVSGDVSATSFIGSGASLTGITLNQILTAGSETSNSVSFGNVTPYTANTYNLGASNNFYQNAYANFYYGDGSNLTNINAGVADTVTLAGTNTDSNHTILLSANATGNEALKTDVGFNYNPNTNRLNVYSINLTDLLATNTYIAEINERQPGQGITVNNDVLVSNKTIKFYNSGNANFIGLTGPATIASDITFVLPNTYGTADQVLKTDGAGNLSWVDVSADTIGNFVMANSTISTDDSSAITITQAVTMQSDATVDGTLTANNIVSDGTGVPTITSASSIRLSATDRVTVTSTPMRLARFSTTDRDNLTALDGDMIYNTTTNKFQGYANGSWVDLH